MKSFRFSRRVIVAALPALVVASSLGFSTARGADAKSADAPQGVRVYSSGHSFHVFVPGILADIAKNAGIADHKNLGVSSIGGSYVHQHWAVEGDKGAKAVIPREKPDIFTMAPIYLPDEGIENFVKLVADESPKTRVLLQEFWLPYDVYDVNYKKQKPATPERDAMTADYLRTEYGKYFLVMDAYVEELNKKFGKQIVFVTPVGQAVVALREKVIAGEVPGITKQSELFTDPIGLPVPGALMNQNMDEETTAKLNKLLQEIAWQVVTAHPLSGVKK